jgi:hypothetical protein
LDAKFLIRSNHTKYVKLFKYLNHAVNLLKQYGITASIRYHMELTLGERDD